MYSDEDHVINVGDDTYTFDLDGFLVSRTIAAGADSGTTMYDYSSRGELLSTSLPNGDVISYEHDPLGRRNAKSINGLVVEKYLWQDATTLLAIYDGSDNLLQRFEYADGRLPVSMTYLGSTYYLAYDQVGSLRAITDSLGNIVKRIDYDSFGNILSDSNPSFTVPFGFAGGLHNRDTGLVRFGARDYDPAIGRWTAKDPIDFAGGDLNLFSYVDSVGKPLSIEINFYSYVGSNPVNRIDPLGLYWEYAQSTGQLAYVDNQTGARTPVGVGYSGNDSGFNSPNMQNVPYVGPIPQGTYDIGQAYRHERLGPVTMNLDPTAGTNTFGRDAFRIHGDNSCGCQSASDGCIILPLSMRNQINRSGDRELRVVR